MIITTNTTLAPGVHYLPEGITIAADGVTFDGGGATIIGAGRVGQGIRVEGRSGVTIKNVRLFEFYHGISARNCADLRIEGCAITATAEEPANTLFLDVWLAAEQAYGGGIFLEQVVDSAVVGNDLQHQQNGLLCYSCSRLELRNNLANYCSGYGFQLFNSSDCIVEGNCADFCCRYEPRGERHGHMGADAAGFLIIHGSCRNIFRNNLARMGGDGFFLAGLRPDLVHVPCNDNLFERNDGSYSPNIAFEATFSSGNIFRDNLANACGWGFWLGFSTNNLLENNVLRGNRQAGIGVENGVGFTVRHNQFERNAHGILLWSKYVAAFAGAVPENDTSRDWLIEHNSFTQNNLAIRIAADQDHGTRPLPPTTPRCPPPRNHVLHGNMFRDNYVDLDSCDSLHNP
jgi:parallel beta-helix repeat protein